MICSNNNIFLLRDVWPASYSWRLVTAFPFVELAVNYNLHWIPVTRCWLCSGGGHSSRPPSASVNCRHSWTASGRPASEARLDLKHVALAAGAVDAGCLAHVGWWWMITQRGGSADASVCDPSLLLCWTFLTSLMNEGHVFCTIDENHFKPTQH